MTGPPLRSAPVADTTRLLGVPLVGLTISPIGPLKHDDERESATTYVSGSKNPRKKQTERELDRGIRRVLDRVIIERLRRGPGETLQHRTAYYQ